MTGLTTCFLSKNIFPLETCIEIGRNSRNILMCILQIVLKKSCLHSQEKQKRDAEEKSRQIRKTLEEQEHLQERLKQQKEESAADNEWLRTEDVRSYTGDANSSDGSRTKLTQRHSWKEGVRRVFCFNIF